MYQTSLSKGQELVAQRMVKEFRAQNYDAFLITSPYHDGELVVSEEEIAKRGGYVSLFDERLGIPVIRVASAIATWPPRRIAFADFVNVLSQIVDSQKLNVLIVHSTLWNGPEDVLKFVEWRRNLARDGFPQLTPIFCHMSHFQDASPERYDMVERSYREAWNSTSLSQVVKGADLVLVVSPYERQVMKDLGADENKLFLFPGGIEDMAEHRSRGADLEEDNQRFHIPPGSKIVTSLGTVEERKNTLAIVQVARRLTRLSNVHFVIAGMDQGEYADKVREEAKLLPNVTVVGPVTEEEKSRLIRHTTVNLIMSRSEALGIAQLEFMANGVPVVSSGTGGQLWVVKSGENGVIIDGPDDIEGAARAVERIAENDSLRRRLGENARKWASSYSMSTLVHNLAKRLESMTQQRADEDRLRLGLPQQEEVLEAMVSGSTRLMVTNRRLMVKKNRSKKEPLSINLRDIKRVVRAVRYPWYVLLGGALLTYAIFVYTASPGYISFFQSLLGSRTLATVVGSLPVFAAGAGTATLFFVMRRIGYFIETPSRRVFIPKEFVRLLRLVDRLIPSELFNAAEGTGG